MRTLCRDEGNSKVTPSARLQSAIELTDLIIESARDNGPAADAIITAWFKTRRYAGSGDRRAVRDLVYRAIRAFGKAPHCGRAAFAAFEDLHPLFDGSAHGPAVVTKNENPPKPSVIPAWLEAEIPAEEREALLGRAPFDLRVNPRMMTRDEVIAKFDGASAIEGTAFGVRLPDNIPLINHPELNGVVEVQDGGSQMIAAACQAKPGQTIIDLCAGAGGKTLALAGDMGGEGYLIACDTDRRRLQQLEPRADLAGISNISSRLLNPMQEADALEDYVEGADCVLVDAPCSGSGTWRRNPELRWRLTKQRLSSVISLQARLLALGSRYVKPGGALVYAVCSLIPGEGQAQIDNFLAANEGWRAEPCGLTVGRVDGQGWKLTPAHDGTDGFFLARLIRT
jgi:16S rRNA (cytosine967-C5)-methyltransferase